MNSGDSPPRDPYDRACRFLLGQINYESLNSQGSKYRFTLDRMRQLVTRLGMADWLCDDNAPPGRPARPPIPTVHIAGTKGKGSTATMVAAMLRRAGFRTGLYTSPHLTELTERFRVDGRPCGRDELVGLVDTVRPIVTQMIAAGQGAPTFFELTTAMAWLHFRNTRCDVQVIEVGLGGRLDSTNVIRPTVTAITSIGLDHQHVLGDTLALIAAEKAGIAKPGVPLISGVRSEAAPTPDRDAAGVIAGKAAAAGAPLRQIDVAYRYRYAPLPNWGGSVRVQMPAGDDDARSGEVHADLAAEGEHQGGNAALAIMILHELRRQGVGVDPQSAAAALSQLQITGRIERFFVGRDVLVILDTAHNPDSVAALCEVLRHRFGRTPDRQLRVVVGSSRDKDVAAMLRLLDEVADEFVLTRFHGNPRFLSTDRLVGLLPAGAADRSVVVEDPVAAVDHAIGLSRPGDVVVVCGSFFLAGETRPHLSRLS